MNKEREEGQGETSSVGSGGGKVTRSGALSRLTVVADEMLSSAAAVLRGRCNCSAQLIMMPCPLRRTSPHQSASSAEQKRAG